MDLATITIERTASDDAGIREIYVVLDGQPMAMLHHGETASGHVVPGPHRLQVHNTLFWKTEELTLQAGEHAIFVAANRTGWGTLALLALTGVGPLYLTFERLTPGRPV